MALIICIDCGAEFSDRAVACPKCGGPNESLVAPQKVQVNTHNTVSDSSQSDLAGRLVVKRKASFIGCLGAIQILLDRIVVGEVKNGCEIFIPDISVGKHELVLDSTMARFLGGELKEVGRKGAAGSTIEIHPSKTLEIEFKIGWTGCAFLSKKYSQKTLPN